jgi:nucleoside-diphosphate-sugar epimerase
MRILITGGLGFLGQHLCRHLLSRYPGCHLTVIDNLSSSIIDHTWLIGNAEIVISDYERISVGRKFDQIYHLASPVGSLGILKSSGYVVKSITDLAVHAGEMAAAGQASLLFVSSSEVYGKVGLQHEADEPIVSAETGTRMEYSIGKLAGEHLLHNLALRHGFRLTIVRPFNIFGEYQSSRIGFVVPTFFELAMAGEPLPLFYGGEQTRCFCHASDVVEALIAIQERGTDRATYNVGHPGNAIAIRDLAAKIKALCQSPSAMEWVNPVERYGPSYLEASAKTPSIEKVQSDTGWTPCVDLDTALQRVYRCYQQPEAPAYVHRSHWVTEA